jgi:hypothetical protein
MLHNDPFDAVLEKWDQELSKYEAAAREAYRAEADFKSFSALKKKTLMDAGLSAAKAEAEVTANADWAIQFKKKSELDLVAEVSRRRLTLAQARFEAERSRQSSLRQVR